MVQRASVLLIAFGLLAAFGVSTTLYLTTSRTTSILLLVPVLILTLLANVLVSWRFVNSRESPVSVRIAIMGMPKSGKTTLIVACFDDIFSHRIPLFTPTLQGAKTIDLLNENIALLNNGRPIRPTRDQDVSAYRFEVRTDGFFARAYRVEFGDFPGEDTDAYVQEYGPWLHKAPFFEWALTADAFVFCIDVGPLRPHYQKWLRDESQSDPLDIDNRSILDEVPARTYYVDESSAIVRAAWQNVVASHGKSRVADLRRSPVLLAFTKADLLLRATASSEAPQPITVPSALADSEETWLSAQYRDLVRFLGGETSEFHIALTSSFAFSEGKRLGISTFIRSVLPANIFIR